MTRRRIGLLALGLGLAIAAGAQLVAPPAPPPLYDGVVVEEPYRYLAPGPGQAGDPTSADATETVTGGASPAFAAATGETPPQAQLIAPARAFAVAAGTAGLHVTIAPVAPQAAGPLVGNAYRFSVTDPGGSPVPLAAGATVTIALRAPPEASDVRIASFGDGTWTPLQTQSGGQSGVYLANVSGLGDFAITGTVAATGGGPDPRLIGLAALLALGAILVLLAVVRPGRGGPARAEPPPPAGSGDRRRSPGRRRT